jgi:hypothetical protein
MLLPDSLEGAAVLDAPAAIAVLLDSRQRAALLPFVGRHCSVAEAAALTAALPNTMRYRVKRWQQLGLLTASEQVDAHKGSPRLYRSSADVYFISHHATTAADLLALAHDIYTPMLGDFLSSYVKSSQYLSDQWGVRFERNGQQWLLRPAKSAADQCNPSDDDAPLAFFDQRQIRLSSSQAKAIKRELLGVIQKYTDQGAENSQIYNLILGFTQSN